MTNRDERRRHLDRIADERIVLLDGAMGTMIQGYDLDEAAYRGRRFDDHPRDQRGNNDLLNLTRPEVIQEIHTAFLAAGSDIIETNTFNATAISQADYGLESLAYDINRAGAEIARAAADAMTGRDPARPRLVAGAVGPTNKTASISPDVNNPGFRNVSFEELRRAYGEAVRGLIDGGVDLLLVETIFDTLNAKAALFAVAEVFDDVGHDLPVMISGTITDLSGRTLSGQTPEAFWISMSHVKPWSIGLNCAFGAAQLRPYVADLARVAEARISAYPNAGLPNEFGAYDEQPDETARQLAEWAQSGLVNIVGGCCGTTPAHIAAIAAAVDGAAGRAIPGLPPRLRLSGLERFELAS